MQDKLTEVLINDGVVEMVDTALADPSRLIPRCRLEILKDVQDLYNRGIPNLSELGNKPSPLGMTTVGDWGMGGKHRPLSVNPDWLLLDWVILLERNADLVELGFPLMAILVHAFSAEAIKRRALWLYELHRRALISGLARYFDVDWQDSRYPPLREWESHAFRAMNSRILNSTAFLGAVRSTFRHYCRPATTEFARLAQMTKNQVSLRYPHETTWRKRLSVFSIRDARAARKTMGGPVMLVGANHPSFLDSPDPVKNPIGYEISFLYRCNQPKYQGVTRLKLSSVYGPRKVDCVVVEMGKYANYRTSTGCTLFEDLRRKWGAQKSSLESLSGRFVDEFIKAYPKLFDPNLLKKISKQRAESIFYSSVNEDGVYVARLSEMKKLFIRRRSMELSIEKMEKKGVPQVARRVRKKSSRPEPYLIESPEFRSLNFVRLTYWVISWYGKNYFSPKKELPPELLYRNPKNPNIKNLLPGVIVHDENFFVTAERLLEGGTDPICRSDDAKSWLLQFDAAGEQRRHLLERRSKLLVKFHYDEDMLPPQEGAERIRFTPDEDDIIIARYRPKMTDDEIAKLRRDLAGRTWPAISRRAKVLCHEMIDAGITDLSKLPHRRVTPKMKEHLREAKRKDGAILPEKKKPYVAKGEGDATL